MHRRHERIKKLAILAYALRDHPDELLADFQQYYGLDLWRLNLADEAWRGDLRRAAALAAQLPPEGRVMAAINPVGRHGTEAWLLRQIELDIRSLGVGEDGKAPEPIWLDGEDEAHEAATERAERDAASLAASFGLNL